ncbi:MAG: UPF0721 transmembrane protein [Saprospiraceae bacterium]|nr:MAG: UPF0721 transmembrane protein [Saprospiraceae bacterium]
MELSHIIIAIVGSFIAGGINTLAGNGSAITLTILTEILGLPANVANGTNRVGVVAQSAASTYSFYRHGKLNWLHSKFYIILMIVGAIVGTLVATWVSNEQFRAVFRFLMVFMLVIILVKPSRWLRETDTSYQLPHWITIPAFLALGFYGGFIQMGMGIFFLAIMVLGARFSLTDSNVVKSLVVGVYTVLAVIIFQLNHQIHWLYGLVMAVGQMTGGYLAATFASRYPHANVWAHRLLVVMIIVAIIMLFDLDEILGQIFLIK